MILNVLYYYYYLIYTKIIPDNEPHATVIFTLSLSEMMIFSFLLEFYLIKNHCLHLPIWISAGMLVFILLFNVLYYGVSKRGRVIVEKKPKLLKSNILSIAFIALVFVSASSYMIFGFSYIQDLLDECKSAVNR